jgi:hypothetical protein
LIEKVNKDCDISTSGVLQPTPDCLLVFIDETGHEELPKGHTVYGLGGCAILASDLEDAINVPWRAVRKLVTGDADKPLHASEFSRNHTKEQVNAVANFFEQPTFMRLAAVLSVETELPNELEHIEVVLQMLGQRIQVLANRVQLNQVAIIFEHSERTKKLIQKYFAGFTVIKDGREVLTEPLWMKKAENEPGLEVADFVMHAVGRQVRSTIEKRQEFPLDFQSGFMKVPSRLISFMRIDRVTGNGPDGMVEGHELR